MTKRIESYTGPYDFLSVRYPSPIVVDGIRYPTVEHAYYAQMVTDDSRRRAIARTTSSFSTVALLASRSITRPFWYSMRQRVVEDLLRLKFEIKDLREKMLNTGDAVLEGRVIDTGVDSNKIMMQLREELREIYRRGR